MDISKPRPYFLNKAYEQVASGFGLSETSYVLQFQLICKVLRPAELYLVRISCPVPFHAMSR